MTPDSLGYLPTDISAEVSSPPHHFKRQKRSKSRLITAPLKVYGFVQGGGALGAHPMAALKAVFEDPRIQIAALSGNSSGGVTVATAAQGHALGGAQGAIHYMDETWGSLTEFQRHCFSLAGLSETVTAGFRRAMALNFGRHGVHASDGSPLSRYFRYMNAKGSANHWNMDIIDRSSLPVTIVASVIPEGTSFWDAHSDPTMRRLFANRKGALLHPFNASGISSPQPITEDGIAASGTLPEMSGPVSIDDVDHWDGVFTANPHFPKTLPSGQCDLAILFCSRPLEAFDNHEGELSATDRKRANYGNVTRAQWQQFQRDNPHTPCIVIQPTTLGRGAFIELDFSSDHIGPLKEAGYAEARKILDTYFQNPDLPQYRPARATNKNRVLHVGHGD